MRYGLLFFVWSIFFISHAQEIFQKQELTNRNGSEYRFFIIKHLDATPVKNQYNTGTCWSFSGLSFIESEIIRLKKRSVNLSEMWVVRNAYLGKAKNYLRTDGHTNFGQGGLFHDNIWVIKNFGLVTEYAYPGLAYGEKTHNHNELHQVLFGMLKALNQKPQGGKLTDSWFPAFREVVDYYLGQVPDNTEDFKFTFEGKTYSPKQFADFLGIRPDDYVEITSFTHHPFYTWFVLEIPDNWNFKQAFNVKMNELINITEHALMNGYTVAWGADVSEKGFSHQNGIAIIPEDIRTVSDKKTSNKFLFVDGEKIPNGFMQPVKEKEVTQQMRQIAFENKRTTDDHGMHIVGIAQDQTGKKYFIVKNSWGDTNDLNGYFFVSYPYFAYKTTMIMVHKDALPKTIKRKM